MFGWPPREDRGVSTRCEAQSCAEPAKCPQKLTDGFLPAFEIG